MRHFFLFANRNPRIRDVLSPFVEHCVARSPSSFPLASVLVNRAEHGRWADHMAGWRAEALANPGQVLHVRYEDLKAQPEVEIRRIASFLDIPVTDALIDRVVEHSGFGAMRKQSGGHAFFRKGEVGDWARHFCLARSWRPSLTRSWPAR